MRRVKDATYSGSPIYHKDNGVLSYGARGQESRLLDPLGFRVLRVWRQKKLQNKAHKGWPKPQTPNPDLSRGSISSQIMGGSEKSILQHGLYGIGVCG